MDTVFDTGSLVGPDAADRCARSSGRCARPTAARIGVEYMYITRHRRRSAGSRSGSKPCAVAGPDYDAACKRHILERLTAAETLEKYLHTRYVGQKRFSLEGGETLIPLLDHLLQRAGDAGRAGDR